MNIALGGMTVTARRGGEHATLVSEIVPPGVNAWRLGALEHLARNTQPGMTPQELAAKLAKIEAAPPLYLLLAKYLLCPCRCQGGDLTIEGLSIGRDLAYPKIIGGPAL
jgi:hypothetical protein